MNSGEAREKLLALKQAGHARAVERAMRTFRKDNGMTENDIASETYNDGWKDGYAAGFQQALDSLASALADSIKAQRSGIMAQW